MIARVIVFAIISFAIPTAAMAQHVTIAVDCKAQRLDAAERETCASVDLLQLTASVDSATRRLESKLTGRNREALHDTEGPFRLQRNNCQNAHPSVRECIERLIKNRMAALDSAAISPN